MLVHLKETVQVLYFSSNISFAFFIKNSTKILNNNYSTDTNHYYSTVDQQYICWWNWMGINRNSYIKKHWERNTNSPTRGSPKEYRNLFINESKTEIYIQSQFPDQKIWKNVNNYVWRLLGTREDINIRIGLTCGAYTKKHTNN